jgi:uncharacterized protein (DUF885 family)
MRRAALVTLWVASVLSGATSATAQQDARRKTTELADAYLTALFARFPTMATYYGVPGARQDELDDNSLGALRAWQDRIDSLGRALDEVDTTVIAGTPELVTYALLREQLEGDRATRVCHTELWPVNQGSGWQAGLTDLAEIQPIGTETLRRAALARAHAVAPYLKTETSNLREGIRLGYTTPRPAVARVLTQIDALLAMVPDNNPFMAPARRDSSPEFHDSLVAVVRDEIYPAMRAYRAYLASEYLPRSRSSLGVGALPEGRRCYSGMIRAATSLSWTGEKVRERGLQRAAELDREMARIASASFHTTDLGALFRRFQTDTAFLFRSAPEIMDSVRAAISRAQAAAPRWFGRLPTARVAAEPVPAFKGGDVSAYYDAAPDDRSRPAMYRVQLHDPERQRRGNVLVTVFHETIPGHHLQIALAQELPVAHPLVKYVGTGAFTEGWAKYAETIADSMGLYGTPAARLQMLESQMPVGMVVDPAIHQLGWTRQRAIDYIVGRFRGDTAFAAMYVDRMSVWPAQAIMYGTGNLFIRQLRQDVSTRLGRQFDVKAFHDVVLRNGAVPLTALEAEVDRWVKVTLERPGQ